MWISSAGRWLGPVLLFGAAQACGDETSPSFEVGEAVDQETAAVYCIRNVQGQLGTVHFQGPRWLLSSAQGRGPLELDVRVLQRIQPVYSTTGTFKLDQGALARAVGYSMAIRYEVIGGARFDVMPNIFQRVEAYTAYQPTRWEVRDAACHAVLGFGTSYKPIGVYFRVVRTSGDLLPDYGVHPVAPMNPDTTGGGLLGPPAGGAGRDAGAKDAGAVKDAGATGMKDLRSDSGVGR